MFQEQKLTLNHCDIFKDGFYYFCPKFQVRLTHLILYCKDKKNTFASISLRWFLTFISDNLAPPQLQGMEAKFAHVVALRPYCT